MRCCGECTVAYIGRVRERTVDLRTVRGGSESSHEFLQEVQSSKAAAQSDGGVDIGGEEADVKELRFTIDFFKFWHMNLLI